MPIRVDCLTCRKWYKAPDKAAGKVVNCPGCGGELKVPADAPPIAEAPKASGSPRPAPAKPVPPPVPAPEPSSFEEDDPFSIPGLTAASPVRTSGVGSVPSSPRPRAIRRRSSGTFSASGGNPAAAIGAWVVGHPLVSAVSAMAAILFLAGVLKGGLALPLAAVGAVGGGVVAVIGLISTGGKSAKKRAAMPTASPKTIFSMIFGGVWTILLIAKPFLREASRLERQGEAVTADAVFSGVLPTVMAFIVLGGGYLAVRRFGLFRVLAPLYLLVAGFGTLMALAVGPTAPGRVDLPPAGAIVAGESGPAAIADPLAPQSAAIGRAVLGGSRAVGDVIRSEYTLPTGAGGGGTPLKFVVYRKVFVNWSQEVATWPCVILAPAGSNLLAGRDLGDGDHPEALPWANAGYVVIQVALPGAIADPERVTGGEVKRTFAEFSAARAGLGCVEQVLAYIKQEMPQVDPRRIAAVGHSSAGTLALLAAESNPEIKACVAFAPCTDVTEFHRDNFAVLETVIPTVRKFCSDYSPINHVDRLQCPIFFFQADDDSVTPVAGAVRFVDAAKEQQKLIEFVRVPIGDHYQSMIDEGIPRAIQWLDATFARAIAPRPSAAPRPAALQ